MNVQTATALEKIGTVSRPTGESHLETVQRGASVAFVTQDPANLLDEAVLASADLTLAIAPATPALLRKVIRRTTGGIARGVTQAMADLELSIILAAIRPDLSARQCVANLDRAVGRMVSEPKSDGPLLSDLPLTKTVRTWSDQVLADLEAVKKGQLPPGDLAYGMLEGPPGTGKTLIGECLARTAGWNFVPTSVGAWFAQSDGALGGVSKSCRSFIDELLTAEPAIGFLDEMDALPDRATVDNRAREWWTTIITLCLTEIDRVKKSGKKVMLLGATNYFSRLDAALVRPGRLAQRVSVLPPESEEEVVALLGYYLRDDIAVTRLHTIARLARGATPALVEGWVKAARAEARAHDRTLDLSDIITQMVPAYTRSPADNYAVALHEIGHAIVALQLGHSVETVSIIPSATSEGETHTVKPTTLVTHEHRVTIILAGRAADIVLGNGPNAGAEGDLAMATQTLLAGYECQGLGEYLAHGPVLGRGRADTRDRVETTLKRLLERAVSIIDANREQVLMLADHLVTARVMSGGDVDAVLAQHGEKSAGIGTPAYADEDIVIEANPR
jgi:hypothetical protein